MASRLQSALTCSLCLDVFVEPVLLSCGCCFCRRCITSFWDSKVRIPTCPECWHPSPGRQCTPNPLLEALVKRAWAMPQEASSSSTQKGAEAVGKRRGDGEGGKGPSGVLCERHGAPVQLFCISDKALICFRCLDSSDHAGHQFSSLKDAAQRYKEKLGEALEHLGTRIKTLEEREEQQIEKISSLRACTASLRGGIEEMFTELHQVLHERQRVMLVQLEEDKQAARGEMGVRLWQIRERLHAAKEAMSQGKTHSELDNPGASCLGIQQFLDILPAKMKVQPDEDEEDLAVLCKELWLGKFKGPAQHLACRPLHPVFMQELEPVRLDPNTAHPIFAITNKGMCVVVQETPVKYKNSPQRFQNYWIVLGKNGFTSGRHYWEVETEDQTGWMIGLVTESIERKKRGPNYFKGKFWSLKLEKTESVSSGASTSCWQIGVYLDYEEGQISFYDGRNGVHLITHRAQFKEKVYPFFHGYLVNSQKTTSMRICQK